MLKQRGIYKFEYQLIETPYGTIYKAVGRAPPAQPAPAIPAVA